MIISKRTQKRLFALLAITKCDKDDRASLCNKASNGRTNSAKEITESEAKKIIDYLQAVADDKDNDDFKKGDKMRKRILSLCYTMGMTKINKNTGKSQVDYKWLNGWMLKYSYLKKPLNDYKYNELAKLVSQFEKTVEHYLTNV